MSVPTELQKSGQGFGLEKFGSVGSEEEITLQSKGVLMSSNLTS